MEALGRLFDLSAGIVPVDLATAANTGKRVSLKNATGVTIVIFKAVGTDAQPVVATLKEHDAGTGGTSQDLVIIDKLYKKTEATLDGDEVWVEVTQTAAATFTEAAADDVFEGIYAIYVGANQLSDDFTHVSLDIADTGATAGTEGCVLYILHDLTVQRNPVDLVAPQ